jgi:DNA-binding IclR family transcriptional regulator
VIDVAVSLDRPPLTPRHLAVLGVLQLSPRPITATAIAHELHFEVAEVLRLLEDITALDRGARG